MPSVFVTYHQQNYPYRWSGSLHIFRIAGGVPTDPKVAESWLRTKIEAPDDMIREAVATVMIERNVSRDEATKVVNENRHLNGFRRDGEGLHIGGYQMKAALKEAANIAVNSGQLSGRGWGKTNKGLLSWLPEHVFVVEDKLHLGVDEPTRVEQRFVHTWRGNGIQYEEIVEDVHVPFTIESDWDIGRETWATIWTHGEYQGIGASRSLGFGRYEVEQWEAL
jgi:hypothetical protein